MPEYKNVREQIAHTLTGVVCGQCHCSVHFGWSKPDMQPKCECYEVAGEVAGMVIDACLKICSETDTLGRAEADMRDYRTHLTGSP